MTTMRSSVPPTALLRIASCGGCRADPTVRQGGCRERHRCDRDGAKWLRQTQQWLASLKGKTTTGFANVEEDSADEAVWIMNRLASIKS
jgi:hypothetical protein